MSRASSRARRNQQVFFLILSVLVVVSMGVSLIATFTPEPRVPTPTPLPPVTLPVESPGTPTVTPESPVMLTPTP